MNKQDKTMIAYSMKESTECNLLEIERFIDNIRHVLDKDLEGIILSEESINASYACRIVKDILFELLTGKPFCKHVPFNKNQSGLTEINETTCRQLLINLTSYDSSISEAIHTIHQQEDSTIKK